MNPLQSVARSIAALRGEGRGRILATVATGWGLLVGTRMSYPVLLPYIRQSFDLSLSVAGLLVTIIWLGSALGQLPGGILADRFNERYVMTAGLAVVAGALSIVALVGSPIAVFVGTGLVGVGLSLYPIARITVLSDIYPDNIGSALGVTMATGDIGQTVLPPAAGFIAGAIAWQMGFGVLVPLFLLLAGLVWAVVPDSDPSAGTEAGESAISLERARDVIEELRTRTMVLTTVVLFVYLLVWQSFTAFYPTYLVDVKDLSPGVAGTVFALFFGVGVLVKPVAGAAYDRFGMRASLLAVLIGPVFGLAVLPAVEGFWTLVGLTAVISTMLGSGAITQSYLADTIPERIRGTGLGVVRTTAATLGSAGPVLFGLVAERGYFDEGYLLLAGLMVLVVAFTLRMPRS
ncbi:MAG: MFS transporter [Halobacteriota archaeon]